MLAYRLKNNNNSFNKWVDARVWITKRKQIYFGAFEYKLFGVVYSTRGIDFDEAFDKYIAWNNLAQ